MKTLKKLSSLTLLALFSFCAVMITTEKPQSKAMFQFSDIENHLYEAQILDIAEKGIIQGYSDGTYKPDKTLNRAELVVMIIRAKEYDTTRLANNCFTDIVNCEWCAQAICKAKELGIVHGDAGSSSFLPADEVNLVEALKIVFEAYEINVEQNTNPWYQGYANEALFRMMIPADVAGFGESITRGQMAFILSRMFSSIENNSATEEVGQLAESTILKFDQTDYQISYRFPLQETEEYTSESYEWNKEDESLEGWTSLITTHKLTPKDPNTELLAANYAQNVANIHTSKEGVILETSVISDPEAVELLNLDPNNPPYLIIAIFPTEPMELSFQTITDTQDGGLEILNYSKALIGYNNDTIEDFLASDEYADLRRSTLAVDFPY